MITYIFIQSKGRNKYTLFEMLFQKFAKIIVYAGFNSQLHQSLNSVFKIYSKLKIFMNDVDLLPY